MIQIAAMALGSHLVLAADRVPQFDTAPSCRSAAVASMMTGRTADNCLADEKNAHDILEKSWGEFSAADKAHCQALVGTGGQPSYVELLSCMEMARDARNLAKDRAEHRPGLVTEPVSEPPADGIGARRAAAAQRSDH